MAENLLTDAQMRHFIKSSATKPRLLRRGCSSGN